MRIIKLFIALALSSFFTDAIADCSSCPECVGCSQCPDFFEPNEKATSPVWSIMNGNYSSYLCKNDVDVWKLPNLQAGQKILLRLEDAPNDYELAIMAPPPISDILRHSSEPERNDGIVFNVGDARFPPGGYFAWVKPGRSKQYSVSAPYAIGAWLLTCSPDEYDKIKLEQNDRPIHATNIPDTILSYARSALSICPGGDQDWYSRNAKGGDTLTVLLDYPRSPGSFELEACLFGEDVDNPVKCIEGTATPGKLEYKVPSGTPKKKYLVRVFAKTYRPPVNPEYALAISIDTPTPQSPVEQPRFPKCEEAPIYESNDRISNIVHEPVFLLNDSSPQQAYICDPTDIDFWAFKAEAGEVLQVALDHKDQPFNLALFNPDRKRVVYARLDPKETHATLAHRVDASGLWFIQVTPETAHFSGKESYTLTANSFKCPDSYEPNDGFLSAPRVFDDDRQVISRICNIGDEDNYVFYADKGQTVYLDLNGRGLNDFVLSLYSPSGKLKKTTSDRMQYTLTSSGDHYLRVYSASGKQYNEVNPYAFSLLIGGNPQPKPEADLNLLNVEITQGIQDLSHSVPLYAHKKTIVRGYAEVLYGPNIVTGAKLFLTYTGNDPLASPAQIQCGNTFDVHQSLAKTDLRKNLALGPYCLLPDSWLRNPGQLKIRAQLQAPSIIETTVSNDYKDIDLKLKQAKTFELQLIPVRDHCQKKCTEEDGPSKERIDEIFRLTQMLYPVEKIIRIPYGGAMEVDSDHGANDVYARLANMARKKPVSANTIRIAVTRSTVDSGVANGHCDGKYKAGYIKLTNQAAETLAHELAHCLGMDHVDDGATLPSYKFEKYPYDGKSIGNANWKGFYGIDFRSGTPVIYPPETTADIMTYQASRWVSDYTYRKLDCLIGSLDLKREERWDKCTPIR